MTPEPRRPKRRPNTVVVGTLKLTYKPGQTGPEVLEGLVRQDDLSLLLAELDKFRVPAQRGTTGRQRRRRFEVPRFRRQSQGRPGLTPIGSTTLDLTQLQHAELINTEEVPLPDLS